MLTGYQHPAYAASFSDIGEPFELSHSQGWLIGRSIPGTGHRDAMGCYPLFCCRDWGALSVDLDALSDRFVSVVLVADPLGDHTAELLASTFDMARPYKEHFVIETGMPPSRFVSASHRALARRALKSVAVEVCPHPISFLDDWERLYGRMATQRAITGIRRFSRGAFERQFAVPGFVMFRASARGQTIGLDLWYVQGESAQGHLAAFDETGYALRASYATKWCAIDYFSSRVRWINLGAAVSSDPDSGLSRFKRGWSTGLRTAWLCHRVLQASAYAEIVNATGTAGLDYLPAYRSGEFS